MGRTISIGAQSFEFIRKNDCFFVDKTGFIKEWWENTDAVTLITRPRRFGKTLNLDMMNCFFSRTYEGRGELFEGLSVWEDKSPDGAYKYRELQGSYPVIFLSFAGIKGRTCEETKQGMKYALERLYREHSRPAPEETWGGLEHASGQRVSEGSGEMLFQDDQEIYLPSEADELGSGDDVRRHDLGVVQRGGCAL